jgi:mttA/Hcf106 family protein
MPSILFILLLALVIFGPRKLPEIATKILPVGQPWGRLTRLITELVSRANQELVSIAELGAEPPRSAIAPIESPSSVGKYEGSE